MSLLLKTKKNIFTISIVTLTIILLIVFRVKQSEEKDNNYDDFISEIFSETIKPIFTSEIFDKKDVLNFALEGNLVIDKNENKVLELRNDLSGREVIGIKKDSLKNYPDNYAKVVETLKLDNNHKMELDSILESYSNLLSQSIYKDEKKTFAIDPNLGQLRVALNKDLSNFISDKKSKNLSNGSTRFFDKKNKIRDYLVFTPDTVFRREYENIAKISDKIEENSKLIAIKNSKTRDKNSSKLSNENFNIHIDSNLVNVTLDNFLNMDELSNIKFFKKVIDSTNNNVKLSFELSGDSTDKILFKFSYADSANNKIRYEMNTDDIGSAVSNSIKIFSGKNLDEWIEYGIKMDSISRSVEAKAQIKSTKKKDGN